MTSPKDLSFFLQIEGRAQAKTEAYGRIQGEHDRQAELGHVRRSEEGRGERRESGGAKRPEASQETRRPRKQPSKIAGLYREEQLKKEPSPRMETLGWEAKFSSQDDSVTGTC